MYNIFKELQVILNIKYSSHLLHTDEPFLPFNLHNSSGDLFSFYILGNRRINSCKATKTVNGRPAQPDQKYLLAK